MTQFHNLSGHDRAASLVTPLSVSLSNESDFLAMRHWDPFSFPVHVASVYYSRNTSVIHNCPSTFYN